MDEYIDGVKQAYVNPYGDDSDVASKCTALTSNINESALNGIREYFGVDKDNLEDEEKIKEIKKIVDPENKLNADEIIELFDKLLKKSGQKWNNSKINQALSLGLNHELYL